MVIQNLGLNTRTDLKYFCTDLSIKGLMAQLGLLLVLIIFAIVNFYLLAELQNHTALCDGYGTLIATTWSPSSTLRQPHSIPCQPTTQVCDKSPSFAPYGI